MSRTIEVIYDGEVFRPATPLDLEPNTKLEITLPEASRGVEAGPDTYAELKQVYKFENAEEIEAFLKENPSVVEFLKEAPSAIKQYFPDVQLALTFKPIFTGSDEWWLVVIMNVEGDAKAVQKSFDTLKDDWWFKVNDNMYGKLSIAVEHPEVSTLRAQARFEKSIGTVEAPEDWSLEHDHYIYGSPKRYQGLENG